MEIESYIPEIVSVMTPSGDIVQIQPSGKVATVENEITVVGNFAGAPVVKKEWKTVVNLPEPKKDTFFLVSSLVKEMLKESRKDLICLDTDEDSALRDAFGNLLSVRRLYV